MAYRIEQNVVRGEIDNREKGVIRGRIWLAGREEPLALELTGNACPDLAGCLLTFENPGPDIAHWGLEDLHTSQTGCIGDLTASRKVREFRRPPEEAYALAKRGEAPEESIANCLYLEWFSERNGRVVIESTRFVLEVSPPEWTMTPEEEQERARQAAAGFESFLARLDDAISQHQRSQKSDFEEWDEHDYERFFREGDARTDKFGELLDKYGHGPEAYDQISKEMGWRREMTEEEEAEERDWIEEMNEACAALDEPDPEPAPEREGIDWIRTPCGDLRHPLQHRCYESAFRFRQLAKDIGLDPINESGLDEFLFEWMTTSVKLAGALSPIAKSEVPPENAFLVAYLKRALGHLHNSQAGLEAISSKNLFRPEDLQEARRELLEIREGILRLMDHYRSR